MLGGFQKAFLEDFRLHTEYDKTRFRQFPLVLREFPLVLREFPLASGGWFSRTFSISGRLGSRKVQYFESMFGSSETARAPASKAQAALLCNHLHSAADFGMRGLNSSGIKTCFEHLKYTMQSSRAASGHGFQGYSRKRSTNGTSAYACTVALQKST